MNYGSLTGWIFVQVLMVVVAVSSQAQMKMKPEMKMKRAMKMKPAMKMKHGMKMKPGMKMEMATEGVFEGVGEVIAVVPAKNQIVLDHKEIKGFMKAMTMGYPVESKALLNGLKPGDAIKFKIDAAKKKIISVERLK